MIGVIIVMNVGKEALLSGFTLKKMGRHPASFTVKGATF